MAEISVGGFGALAYFHHRFAPRPRAIIGAALAALIVLRVGDCLLLLSEQRNDFSFDHSHFMSVATKIAFLWPLRIFLVAAVVLLAWQKPGIAQRFVRITRLSIVAFAFQLVWIVPQVLHLAFGIRPTHRVNAQAQAISGRRIVWVLFDELSYKLAFESTPDGIALPNFHDLRSHSVSFEDLQAIGVYTNRIIPSLLGGQQINSVRSDSTRELLYFNPSQSRWLPFDQEKSLFGLAHSAGWNVGVEGWYNPYCRIFSTVLYSCSWEPADITEPPIEIVGASEENSSLLNASILLRAFLLGRTPTPAEMAARRAQVYARLVARSQDLLRNEQVNFVFVHLSAPHPPAFFDRKTHKMCACGNYIDNLVLADDTLGEFVKQIDQSPEADNTTLIVSSDHSWRVPMWRGGPFWTPEEEQISQGQFDSRPVFLVHFPGQQSPVNILSRESELVEHDIVAAILQKKIDSSDTLVSFLRRSPPSQLASGPPPPKP